MRGVAVAVEAVSLFSSCHGLKRPSGAVAEERLMAAEAVLLHYAPSRFADIYCLRFIAQGKDCGMPQTVVRLEIVFADKVVMRHVAGIAVCYAAMRTVRPGGELWRHYMAIDADPGVIRQIGSGIGYPEQVES